MEGDLDLQDPEDNWRTGFFKSQDYGATWTDYVEVARGLAEEMSLVKLPSGRWLAMIRPGPALMAMNRPCLSRSYSQDGGKTWSKPEATEVLGACPCLFLTKKGTLVCVYSDLHTERASHTSLSYSWDEGATWVQEDEPVYSTSAQGGSYPSMVYADSQRILCVHDTQYCDEGPDIDTNCNIEGMFFEEE